MRDVNSRSSRPAYEAAGKPDPKMVERLKIDHAKGFAQMPVLLGGQRRFSSRSDGVEAGIVTGGLKSPRCG